jgi:hypothetical protein
MIGIVCSFLSTATILEPLIGGLLFEVAGMTAAFLGS